MIDCHWKNVTPAQWCWSWKNGEVAQMVNQRAYFIMPRQSLENYHRFREMKAIQHFSDTEGGEGKNEKKCSFSGDG